MEDIAMLGLGVDSRPVDRGRESLKKFEDQAGRTELATRGLEHTTGLLTRAMGLLGAAFSVTQLIRMTSVWTDLNSRVRNAVSAHESASDVMKRIEEMARRTYSSLEQTAESYLRNSSALTALGYSTAQQLDLTESLNNALVVSAIKGQQAESVMNAWSKAMALGKLSGDNLNTVIMSGGRVAEALAESMGVSVLELRKLGEEGKITGDKMFGITSQLEKLREEADAMPATIQDAFLLIGNAILGFVGRVDQAISASSGLAEMLIGVADAIQSATGPAIEGVGILIDNLPTLLSIGAAFAAFWVGPYVQAMVAARVATFTLSGALGLLRGALIRTGIGALVVLAGELISHLIEASNKSGALGDAMRAVGAIAGPVLTKIGQTVDALGQTFDAVARGIEAVFVGAFATIYEQYANLVNAISDGMNAVGMKNNARMNPQWATGIFKGLVDEAAASAELAAKKWVAVFSATPKMDDIGPGAEWSDMKSLLGGGKTKPPPGADPTKDQEQAAKKYDELIAATERRTASLKAEAEAMGLTGVEAQSLINLHELMADAEATGVEMTEARIEQITRLSEAMTDAELTLEGLHMQMENRSPWETMAEEMERLQELLDRGKIGWDDYAIGVGKATQEMVGAYTAGASDVIGNIEKITDAMGLEGKKAFEVQKALGIARAVVSGAESITHSFNAGAAIGGPPVGFAFAGIAAAATAAQIAALASTSYQSKNVPGSAAGGGGATPAAPAAPAPTQTVNVTLQGQSYGRDQIRELLERIDEYSRDGSMIRVHI